MIDAERGSSALDSVVADEDDVAIAAITVAELKVGVELAKSAARRRRREAFVDAVLGAVSIEPYDREVADAHAVLLAHSRRLGLPRGAHDLIIAATGRAREREVLTSDLAGFGELPGVRVRDR